MLGSRVVKGVWQIREGLELDYLATDSSSPGVEDLWVDWKQVLLLLGELKPKFSQIWTLKAVSYCPLLDVLQAAITSTGLVRELLDSLVQPLLKGDHLEEVDYQNGESNAWRADEDKSEEEEPHQIILDDLENGENEQQQQDHQLVGKDVDAEKRCGQERRKVPTQLSPCTICSAQLSGRIRLYSHYVTQHPDSPSLHPARPPGALHDCPVCGELYSRRSLLRRHQNSTHQEPGLNSQREEHGESAESNACLCCGRTFATSIWLYKHCIADHPDRTDIRPEPPLKVKGLRLAHLHEREELQCGLPGCDLHFTHFKVINIPSVESRSEDPERKETRKYCFHLDEPPLPKLCHYYQSLYYLKDALAGYTSQKYTFKDFQSLWKSKS